MIYLCEVVAQGVQSFGSTLCTRTWYHSCNTRNATAYGKYLGEVDPFDIDGIQGRHIAEYFEQRRPNVGMHGIDRGRGTQTEVALRQRSGECVCVLW